MPISQEERDRLLLLQRKALSYYSDILVSVEQTERVGFKHEPDTYYAMLLAATMTLDRDDREQDAKRRGREVFATLLVAAVATFATGVQGWAAWKGRDERSPERQTAIAVVYHDDARTRGTDGLISPAAQLVLSEVRRAALPISPEAVLVLAGLDANEAEAALAELTEKGLLVRTTSETYIDARR